MSDFSPLCKACKIFEICHEPQKYMANACIHFKGELPNGYVLHGPIAVKLVYKKGFASNIAYLDFPNEKMWLEQWQVNDLLRSSRSATE